MVIPCYTVIPSSCILCRYLPARIISTFHHYGHELNSQVFLTIYFCTRFLCDKKFCINIVCVTKFCTFISTCVLSLLSKINVQIFVKQKIVMQQILMQKMMLQKFFHKNFCGFIFATTVFLSKILTQIIFA